MSWGMQESMRALPVAGGTVREARRDVLLGGKYLIPARTPLFLPLHAIHNTWRNFEQPGAFLPERWAAPGAEYARPGLTPDSAVPGAHTAFSARNRTCRYPAIAMRYASRSPSTHCCRGLHGQHAAGHSQHVCLLRWV